MIFHVFLCFRVVSENVVIRGASLTFQACGAHGFEQENVIFDHFLDHFLTHFREFLTF